MTPFEQFTRSQWNAVEESGTPAQREEILTAIHRRLFPRRILWFSAAAAAVAAVVAALFLLNPSIRPDALAPEGFTILAETPQTVDLPDGSRVWLEKDSRLAYSQPFDRKVSLTGDATFEVSKMEGGTPFLVLMEDSFVEVKGTTFSINQEGSDNISVTLFSGAVDFVSTASGERVSIQPSQTVTYSKENASLDVTSFFQGITWQDGNYVFNNADLIEIARFIAWKYGVTVDLDAGIGTGQMVSGKIGREESVGAVMDQICFLMDLDYSKEGSHYQLHKN